MTEPTVTVYMFEVISALDGIQVEDNRSKPHSTGNQNFRSKLRAAIVHEEFVSSYGAKNVGPIESEQWPKSKADKLLPPPAINVPAA
jgi:hypothetical protein